jgi:hypothetical protein
VTPEIDDRARAQLDRYFTNALAGRDVRNYLANDLSLTPVVGRIAPDVWGDWFFGGRRDFTPEPERTPWNAMIDPWSAHVEEPLTFENSGARKSFEGKDLLNRDDFTTPSNPYRRSWT